MTVSSRPPKKPLIVINGRAVHYMHAEITAHYDDSMFSDPYPRRTRPIAWTVALTRQPTRGMFVTETYSGAQIVSSLRQTDRMAYTLNDAWRL